MILRHYHAPDRTDIAQRLRTLTRQHHILLLIAGDADLAQACDADGVHLPKWVLSTLTSDTRRRWQQDNGWRITASVHTRAEHGRACQWGVDAALLAPIFPTKSHPGHPGLGVEAVTDIAQISPIPVCLGGMTAATVPHLQNSGLWGVAGISNFLDPSRNRGQKSIGLDTMFKSMKTGPSLAGHWHLNVAKKSFC